MHAWKNTVAHKICINLFKAIFTANDSVELLSHFFDKRIIVVNLYSSLWWQSSYLVCFLFFLVSLNQLSRMLGSESSVWCQLVKVFLNCLDHYCRGKQWVKASRQLKKTSNWPRMGCLHHRAIAWKWHYLQLRIPSGRCNCDLQIFPKIIVNNM